MNSRLTTQRIATNIARGLSPGCETDDFSLTDGNRSVLGGCGHIKSNETFTFVFPKNYRITHVTVYSVASPHVHAHNRSLINATLISRSGNTMCYEHPKNSIYARNFTDGVKLNCAMPHRLSKELLLFTNFYKLSEVEIYTFAGIGFGIFPEIHRGCFKNVSGARRYYVDDDIETCVRQCRTIGSLMAYNVMEDTCLCSNDYDDIEKVPTGNCTYTCTGIIDKSIKRCGGVGVFSLYLIDFALPRFLQCTQDFDFRYWPLIIDMTIVSCIQRCKSSLNVWMVENRCFCNNDTITARPHECTTKCHEHEVREICGRSVATIYASCNLKENKLLPCHKLFKCKDGIFDSYGNCTLGCARGYMEDFCLEATYDDVNETNETERASENLSLKLNSRHTVVMLLFIYCLINIRKMTL